MKALEATVFRLADNRPMVRVHNFPGLDAEMTPEQMRSMAAALTVAATECEKLPTPKKGRGVKRKLIMDIDSGKAA